MPYRARGIKMLNARLYLDVEWEKRKEALGEEVDGLKITWNNIAMLGIVILESKKKEIEQ